MMSSIANITVCAEEDIYRDKARRFLRVPKGRKCGFRVYTNTKMREIMDKIAKFIWNVPVEALRFIFAGETVGPNDDFTSLHMRELDSIEVYHDLSFFEMPPSTIASDFRKLVGSKDGADFLFKVGKPSSSLIEGLDQSPYKEIPAHRWILKVRNERFRGLFDTKMEESTVGSVTIHDHKPQAFEQMLEYLYTDEIEGGITPDDRLELLILADEYVIPRLKRKVELELIPDVKQTNAIEYYIHADLHQANDLKAVCRQFVIDNFFELKQNSDFMKALSHVPDLLIEITSSAIESLKSFKKQRTT